MSIVSDDPTDSKVLFHEVASIGSFVYAYCPDYSEQCIGDVSIVKYKDVLYPVDTPEENTLTSSVPKASSFADITVMVKYNILHIKPFFVCCIIILL